MSADERIAEQAGSQAVAEAPSVAEKSTAPPGRWFTDKEHFLFIADDGSPIDPVVMPLHDAVLLNEYDELLCCIDAWLKQAHDWRPVQSEESMPLLQMTLYLRSNTARCVSLHLSDTERASTGSLASPGSSSEVPLRSELPAEWQAQVTLEYHEHPATLILESLRLSEQDLQRLAGGALVVLPSSFEPEWRVSLNPLESSTADALPASLNIDTGQLLVAPALQSVSGWLSQSASSEEEVATAIDNTNMDTSASAATREVSEAENQIDAGANSQAQSSDYTLLVSLSRPLSINLRVAENSWRIDESLSINNLPSVSRMSVSLRLAGSSDEDFAKSEMHGTLLRIGQGLGVIIDNDSSLSADESVQGQPDSLDE